MSRSLDLLRTQYAGIMARQEREEMRAHALGDRFFLLTCILQRQDAFRQWILERCDEVQVNPDGYIDLWARYHYKSTIITLAGIIQEVLRDRELTVCILSFNRKLAKGLLNQVKREFEERPLLKELFPEVLWSDARREAPKWSENEGIVVKRSSNPKEQTVEAYGLIDSLPVGNHYKLRVYDDMVVPASVTSPDMIKKTINYWEQSLALTTEGGREWYLGTTYHFADPYFEMKKRGTVKARVHQAEKDGVPVLLSRDQLANLRRDMGPYTFAAQMMLDPKSGDSIGFRDEWLATWHGRVDAGNRYLVVDPANSKRKRSDYTSMWLVELCADGNSYVRDMVRDRLNLAERVEMAIQLHRQWQPKKVGWEEYGLAADVEALEAQQSAQGYRFPVTKLAGPLSKEDRIAKLIPVFAARKMWLPSSCRRMCRYSGREEDLVEVFLNEEYRGWPYVAHDDMLDALARIEDPELGAVFPKLERAGGGRQRFATTAASELD